MYINYMGYMNYTTCTRFNRDHSVLQYSTEVDATFSRIISVFGQPQGQVEMLREYRWYIQFENGDQVLIWMHEDDIDILCDNSHEDPRYHHKDDYRENMNPWRIRGNSLEALDRVESMIGS